MFSVCSHRGGVSSAGGVEPVQPGGWVSPAGGWVGQSSRGGGSVQLGGGQFSWGGSVQPKGGQSSQGGSAGGGVSQDRATE